MNDTLVTENINLVPFAVRKYFRPQSDFEEWCSVGNIGLIKAAKTFDPDQKAAFSTFATKCICNEINRVILGNSRKKRVATKGFVYLDHEDEDKEVNRYDLIRSEGTGMEDVENKMYVDYLLSLLKEREKELLILHFGLNGVTAISCTEIAQKMGCSKTRVSQIIRKALERLRERTVSAS